MARAVRSMQFGLSGFLAAFVDGQFFVQARDHFADAGLGEPFRTEGGGFAATAPIALPGRGVPLALFGIRWRWRS